MPERYVCDTLEEMRKCYKTRNFAPLLGLIEEAQIMVNRMEAALHEQRNHLDWHKKAKEEKAELKRLLEKTNELREKADESEKTIYGVG